MNTILSLKEVLGIKVLQKKQMYELLNTFRHQLIIISTEKHGEVNIFLLSIVLRRLLQ